MDFVARQGPWLVDRLCVSTKKWEEGVPLRRMEFHSVSFWVQIHRLPLERVTHSDGFDLGAKIGQVEKVDEGENFTEEGPFLMVRVALDTRNHL